ncbi:MAG TPA: LON peptidase substrate-binding domain-containing protein [Terriglobales bacterium]|nr:LON peptidase substrate-binding domain-containing protein [Terriglobales bacterium]
MESSLLPLFPLDLVLFPDTPLPLHVFEPRYKEMIGECLERKLEFGVVRAKESSLAEIGCTAEIVTVTKKYDDGRLDIVSEGRRRFQIRNVNHERSFLQGEVTYFEDEPGAIKAVEVQKALQLHRQIMDLLTAESAPPDPEDPQLSFHLAGGLPLDLDFKQTLLGLRSESERVVGLIEYYEAILPNLRRAVKARDKAGGNGHAG